MENVFIVPAMEKIYFELVTPSSECITSHKKANDNDGASA